MKASSICIQMLALLSSRGNLSFFVRKMGMIITTMSFASQQCFREQGDGVYNEASSVFLKLQSVSPS